MSAPRVEVLSQLGGGDLSAVRTLLEEAEQYDGAGAIGEHKFLRLSGQGAEHVAAILVRENERLVGYANTQCFPIDGAGGLRLAVELVVRPERRRQGIASSMLEAAIDLARSKGASRVDAWAYHQMSGTRELARKFGFVPSRTLLEVRMELRDLPAEASTGLKSAPADSQTSALPDGIQLRAFQPGQDDEEWLALNRLIFAGHAEQAHWDRPDLTLRLSQPWFEAQDFLVAIEAGRLVAFNWLKLDQRSGMGEIYVVGVHPDLRGKQLGRSLNALGLAHMKKRGMQRASAYVDASNSAALRMYYALGFVIEHADLCYSKPLRGAGND